VRRLLTGIEEVMRLRVHQLRRVWMPLGTVVTELKFEKMLGYNSMNTNGYREWALLAN